MADCCCSPDYSLSAAEISLSPRLASEYVDDLHQWCLNPIEQGCKNEEAGWLRNAESHARRLVWC